MDDVTELKKAPIKIYFTRGGGIVWKKVGGNIFPLYEKGGAHSVEKGLKKEPSIRKLIKRLLFFINCFTTTR